MCILQSVCVAERFVAAHEIAEGVPDEDLLNVLRPSQYRHQLGRTVDAFAVKLLHAGAIDPASGIHGLASIAALIAAVMIVALEGHA